ncbi:EAL domain-containing protein [Zoogloea sp. LCSB751]|uniref:bifunctional diguanylate cyclase/phosphodiesterase n=1 Tax=Zoogloea sp. LCSB751 TaxID=1965277 RepID=UPI000B496907|nr:EAL domain-containing protein [Zoogloea sp. LCSB751]
MSAQAGLSRRSIFFLVVLLVLFSACSATAYGLWRLRAERVDRQLEAAAMTARAFENHLTQSLNVIDSSLVSLAAEGAERASLPQVLRHAPYLRSVAVLDAQDRIWRSTDHRNLHIQLSRSDFRPAAPRPLEVLRAGHIVSGRDFYEAGPMGSSAPVVSFIPVARDVRLDDARWLTVVASVNTDYFLNFYSAHISPEQGVVELRDYDGRLLLSTDDKEVPGSLRPDDDLTSRLAETEVGQFEERDTDSRVMLTAYRASRAYPFVLSVRLDKGQALAVWQQEAKRTGAIVAVALLAALALAGLYFMRFERLARERESERARLRIAAIAFESQEGMVVTNADVEVLQVNKAFTAITGFRAEDVIGQYMNFMKSGMHDADFYAAIRGSLASLGAWSGEILNKHRDGSIHPHFLTITAVRGDDGQATHYVGTLTDITERKSAEIDLRIAAIAFESQEGMFIADADRIILKVNRAFTEITGYSEDEAIGQTPHLLHSGRHAREFYANMYASLETTGAWQGEIWNRRKSGEIFPEWLTITVVRDANGRVSHYVAALTDITLRKEAEYEIKNLAFYDPLTRLPNRRLLLDRLKHALAILARSQRQGALLFIDLDNFKTLNDTFGHDMGDLLLQHVAQRLSGCIREGDTVARLGGDEFVVLLDDLRPGRQDAATQARIVADKILSNLDEPYDLAGHDYHCTPSIGITLIADSDSSCDELMKRADLALYGAKAAGRNTVRFFDPEMQEAVSSRAALEKDLRIGLQQAQFLLHYQPQVNEQGTIIGAEALVRWQHPQLGMVAPGSFISLAEETGLILPLGQWVLETACRQLACWAAMPGREHIEIAVNVSVRQFRQPDFVDQVEEVLARTAADPHKLKLELTESLMLNDVEEVVAKMAALRSRGIRFSLDDFGTGYSSLAYLRRLPLDQLKIDKAFVDDVQANSNDAVIARSIVALARNLGLNVIAEGVETPEQHQFLARQGCLAYQGYLFSRPLPIDEFERFLDEWGAANIIRHRA